MGDLNTNKGDNEQNELQINNGEHAEQSHAMNKAEQYARLVTERQPADSKTVSSIFGLLRRSCNAATDELKNFSWAPELKGEERKKAIIHTLKDILDAATAYTEGNPHALSETQAAAMESGRETGMMMNLGGISQNERDVLASFMLHEGKPTVLELVSEFLKILEAPENNDKDIDTLITSFFNEHDSKNVAEKQTIIESQATKGRELYDLLEQLHPDIVNNSIMVSAIDLQKNKNTILKNIAILKEAGTKDAARIDYDDCTVGMAKEYLLQSRDHYHLTPDEIENVANSMQDEFDGETFVRKIIEALIAKITE